MGKKRKASQKAAGPSGPRDVDPKDARLGPVTSWKDVADSEDEYFLQREEIALEELPLTKRQKQIEEEEVFLEPSDEEVLGYDDDDDSDEEVDETDQHGEDGAGLDDEAPPAQQEDGQDSGWWGASKKDYYEADPIATEAEALEEEQEARRIQQKRLARMTEADFIDETEWLAAPAAEDGQDVVVEVLQDVEVSSDMTPGEQTGILQARYPEFSFLAEEFQQLQELLPEVERLARGQPGRSLAVVKYYVLGSLVAALASYFALLTSPARDSAGDPKALSPAELRDHEIMETLLRCRDLWQEVKDVKASGAVNSISGLPSPPNEDGPADVLVAPAKTAVGKKINPEKAHSGQGEPAKKKKEKKSAEMKKREKEVEDSIADLSSLLKKPKRSAKSKVAPAVTTEPQAADDRSDFGEDEFMDIREGAEKAARKKSLRFYTSQIVQKSNKRAEGARNAGGDDDIPYRERLKDRQARLQAEAERRGKRDSKFGADLDPDGASDDDEDTAMAGALRDQEDEYYDMMAQTSSKKKAEKAEKYAALAAARRGDRVVEVEEVGEDNKRKISYAIEKNKGMTPRRRKEIKNPRVKKREQFKKKQQKLRSSKPMYKGGEGPGGYAGETSGIKAGLVKSVKL